MTVTGLKRSILMIWFKLHQTLQCITGNKRYKQDDRNKLGNEHRSGPMHRYHWYGKRVKEKEQKHFAINNTRIIGHVNMHININTDPPHFIKINSKLFIFLNIKCKTTLQWETNWDDQVLKWYIFHSAEHSGNRWEYMS